MTVRPVIVAALSLVAAALLAGCSSTPAPEPSADSMSSAAPSAEQSLPPAEPDTELFRVEAKARAVDGTTMDIALIGHQPVPATDADAEELAEDFLSACEESGGLSVTQAGAVVTERSLAQFGSSLMRIDYSATPDDQTLFAPIEVIVGIDNLARIGTGDALQLLQETDTCLNRYLLVESGAGAFIANFETGSADPDPTQWTFGSYGFTVPVDSGATLESCAVTISDLGASELAGVPGWPSGEVGTGISCGTGFTGE